MTGRIPLVSTRSIPMASSKAGESSFTLQVGIASRSSSPYLSKCTAYIANMAWAEKAFRKVFIWFRVSALYHKCEEIGMRYQGRNFLFGSRIRGIIVLWIVLAFLVSVASAASSSQVGSGSALQGAPNTGSAGAGGSSQAGSAGQGQGSASNALGSAGRSTGSNAQGSAGQGGSSQAGSAGTGQGSASNALGSAGTGQGVHQASPVSGTGSTSPQGGDSQSGSAGTGTVLGPPHPGIPVPILELGDAQSPETGTLRIPVMMNNAQGIGAMKLVFNTATEPDFLTFVSCDQGEIATGSFFDCNYNLLGTLGSRNFYKSTVGLATTNGISGSGNLVYLNFKYNPSFAGTKTVILYPQSTQLESYNLAGQRDPTVTIGSYKVYYVAAPDSSLAGDANGDGSVTSKDALLALQMATGTKTPNTAADMDKNGNVQVNDALLILQKAAMVGAAGAGNVGVGKVVGVMSLNPSSEADLPVAVISDLEALKTSKVLIQPTLAKASPQLSKALQVSQNQQQAQDNSGVKGGVRGGVAQDQQLAQDKMAVKG